jgi:hypothetical protein
MESQEFEGENVIDAELEEIDEDLEFEEVDEIEDSVPRKPVIAMSTLPITGEPRVDDALARLNEIPGLPANEQVAVFEDVQRRLHETLADLSNQ